MLTQALPWLLPAASVFGTDRVFLRTPSRNFTAADLASPLREAGAGAAADAWAKLTHLTGQALAPNVSTVDVALFAHVCGPVSIHTQTRTHIHTHEDVCFVCVCVCVCVCVN